ncbi:hypothetical protein ACSMXN_04125 [Jatrophihabitans sp. DSM 45814]
MFVNSDRHASPREVYLPSVPTSVPTSALLADERLRKLAVEDACWAFAFEDWQSRRPSCWNFRMRRAWRREEDHLEDAREALRALADQCGCP